MGRTYYVPSKGQIRHGIHSGKTDVVAIFVPEFTTQISPLLSEWVPEAFTCKIIFILKERDRVYESLGPTRFINTCYTRNQAGGVGGGGACVGYERAYTLYKV